MGNSSLVVARATGGSLGSILLISAFPKRGTSPQAMGFHSGRDVSADLPNEKSL